jgi:hypothetical protein
LIKIYFDLSYKSKSEFLNTPGSPRYHEKPEVKPRKPIDMKVEQKILFFIVAKSQNLKIKMMFKGC